MISRGVRIDGNDIFAVYFETLKALERARNGEGPTLIEAVTWRYGAHTTADDPTKYRDQSESDERRKLGDPIARLQRYMERQGWWDQEWADSVQKEYTAEMDQAVEELESYPEADPKVIFDYVFEKPTWTISEQKDLLLQQLRGEG
ncbi:pyruvate dehydrogenase E1 (lipoamide) alpha subunit [Bacillus sp. SG-1]|nr:pyruvate dehydrogenase E1 (lipoamide) alpha subunit [Bacillus sp. SG-1]